MAQDKAAQDEAFAILITCLGDEDATAFVTNEIEAFGKRVSMMAKHAAVHAEDKPAVMAAGLAHFGRHLLTLARWMEVNTCQMAEAA